MSTRKYYNKKTNITRKKNNKKICKMNKINKMNKISKLRKGNKNCNIAKGGTEIDNDIKGQIIQGLKEIPTDQLSDNERNKIIDIINGESFNKKFDSIMKKIQQNVKNKMDSATKNKINKMILELLFQPDTSKLYSKQGSPANDSYETGDIHIRVKNKDANWVEHIKKKFRSVDSMLANILNKCNDWACLTNNNPPLIAKETIVITDDRTDVDTKI
jgi:hypothetical protein